MTPFIRERLLRDVDVAGSSTSTLLEALTWGMRDAEDALQAAAALNDGASFITTRNSRDFRASKFLP